MLLLGLPEVGEAIVTELSVVNAAMLSLHWERRYGEIWRKFYGNNNITGEQEEEIWISVWRMWVKREVMEEVMGRLVGNEGREMVVSEWEEDYLQKVSRPLGIDEEIINYLFRDEMDVQGYTKDKIHRVEECPKCKNGQFYRMKDNFLSEL